MTMSNEEMLVAITELFNSKFSNVETNIQKLDSKFSDMETNIQKLDNKIDETKQDLIDRMDVMENDILNSCLGYTDDQNESVLKKLDNLQSTVNTATRLKTIDNDVYNLVNRRIDELDERVERLEKIS